MLWNKNKGTSLDEVLQNQFSAYVKRSVYRHRVNYLTLKSKVSCHETNLDFLDKLPGISYDISYVELDALRRALQDIKEKERRIILAHIVEEKSFVEIAIELNMTYKAVTGLYYRVMEKLRKYMEGGTDYEF